MRCAARSRIEILLLDQPTSENNRNRRIVTQKFGGHNAFQESRRLSSKSCHICGANRRLTKTMNETELRNSLLESHSASYAWAMTCCRGREVAEDVLQSVYVKVLAGRSQYEGRSSFQTWLFAVIRNAARDSQRKRWWSRVLRLDSESLAKMPELTVAGNSDANDEDELSQIRGALGKLPERQREIAHLVFYEDLTIADAASVMGVSVGTARQHYSRAKDALRISLAPLWNEIDESITK